MPQVVQELISFFKQNLAKTYCFNMISLVEFQKLKNYHRQKIKSC